MDKSIMAMAYDILGGALSSPSKAQSQLSNPYNEPELPELSDQLRESMMNGSTKHLNEEQPYDEGAPKKKMKAVGKKKPAKKKACGSSRLGEAQVQILLQARDILREVTGVGGIGVGPQMTASRAFSTHGADMGKDTVKIEPVDKALRKTEKGNAKKKKKVKKESFELFIDAILNETQEIK